MPQSGLPEEALKQARIVGLLSGFRTSDGKSVSVIGEVNTGGTERWKRESHVVLVRTQSLRGG